jgi:Uma2 family endonuclease
MTTKIQATIEDLYHIPDNGKAEIVDGEIVTMSPTGGRPGRAGGKIFISLDDYESTHGGGFAFGDNVGFIVDLPGRKSFSPDAAFYIGEIEGLSFLKGAPVFAVEVRSENDYGPIAEKAIAQKRADYFAAGTKVFWDVDLLSDTPIKCYRSDDPDNPRLFRRGEIADAEPALPGWRMAVDLLFS